MTLDSYSYSQILDKSQIDDFEDDYYLLRRRIRNGVDSLAEKAQAREGSRPEELAAIKLSATNKPIGAR